LSAKLFSNAVFTTVSGNVLQKTDALNQLVSAMAGYLGAASSSSLFYMPFPTNGPVTMNTSTIGDINTRIQFLQSNTVEEFPLGCNYQGTSLDEALVFVNHYIPKFNTEFQTRGPKQLVMAAVYDQC